MARTYLVRRGADAEDEPRGEVGPGDVRGRGRRRRPDAAAERGQEKESSTAERLPHHVSAPAGRARGVCGFIYLSVGRGRPSPVAN